MNAVIVVLCALLVIATARECNVYNYGAKGDGVTMDTIPIKKAISDCSQAPGNVLLFPPGNFLTAPFNLTSNLNVEITPNATLLASQNPSDWPIIPPLPSYCVSRDTGQLARYQSFLFATNVSNLAIYGGGTINGQGSVWWNLFKNNSLQAGRGRLIEIMFGQNILLTNLTLSNSPFWTVHPYACNNVTVTHLYINNPANVGNTDGVDPDSSSNVYVSDCLIHCGDDNIAVKSGINWCGRQFNVPSVNITVERCNMTAGNGLAIGSEMSGGVKNVTFRDITLYAGSVIYQKTARGRGGYIEDIYYLNITLIGASSAISVSEYYDGNVPPTNATATPTLRNFYANTIVGTVNGPGLFNCLPESPCSNYDLNNINLKTSGSYSCSDVKNITGNNDFPTIC